MGSEREACPKECPRYEDILGHPCLGGEGPKPAKIMVVGEAPGGTEDEQGRPFVGRSGKLLDRLLNEVGIRRKDIRIVNATKCLGPTPNKTVIKYCKPYLVEEIKQVQPNVICALGAVALESLLDRTGISKLKNNVFINDQFGIDKSKLNRLIKKVQKCQLCEGTGSITEESDEETHTRECECTFTLNTYIEENAQLIKVIPTYHPAHVLRNPAQYVYLKKGLELVAKESLSKGLVGTDKIKTKYLVADTKDKVEQVLNALAKQKEFSFDLETNSLNYLQSKILCVSVSWQIGLGIVIPWDLLVGDLREKFNALLLSDRLKIGQNIKFDIQTLLNKGTRVKGPFFCTLNAEHVIDTDRTHALDDQTLHYLDMGEYWEPLEVEKARIAKEKGIKKTDVTYDMIDPKILYLYAGQDADATFRLYKIHKPVMEKKNLLSFYNDHVMPFMPVLVEMEYRGIHIDRKKLKTLIDEYNTELDLAKKKLHEDPKVKEYEELRKKLALRKLENKYEASKNIRSRYPDGVEHYYKAMLKEKDWVFNFGSTKQLSGLLFEYMGLTPVKLTDTGKYSTDEEVMNVLAEQNVGIATGIVENRKLSKYISTYLVATYRKSAFDNRIHASFLQAKPATGRLSCTEPNLQNIPRKAKDFKECFLADPGYVFLKADLAQAEFRCWAHYANDKKMIADIESGLDIHRKIAAQMLGIPESEVTGEQRNQAKGTNFGLMFGRGDESIAVENDMLIEQVKQTRSIFFDTYPVATQWLEDTVNFAKRNKYVKSWFGRIRPLYDIDSDNRTVRAEAERQAKNTPIQAQASDMNNAYMVRTLKKARRAKIDCFPTLTVHDANFWQVRKAQVTDLMKVANDVVATAFPDFRCRMELDFEVGGTLGTFESISL